jgi:hypothetical protein
VTIALTPGLKSNLSQKEWTESDDEELEQIGVQIKILENRLAKLLVQVPFSEEQVQANFRLCGDCLI